MGSPRTLGTVAPGFEAVQEVFEANFTERGEVGAAVCAYVGGRPVVDLWGGRADATSDRPWEEDTVVSVFSASKGVTAICANLLIERSLLDPEVPVAEYWPEFAAAGKGATTVGQVLSHQAGLPLVEGECTLAEALSWDPMVERLAAQAPLWPPGTQHGYHMRTFGWLVGELIRRVSGRTAGRFLAEEVAAPLGLDLWIGLPEEVEPRVARLVPPSADLGALLEELGADLLLTRVFSNPGGHFAYDEMWNTRELHACELPSSNGIASARSLARLYASLIGDGVEGSRTLSAETVAVATTERASGTDAVLGVPMQYGLGFMLGCSFGASNRLTCFGHGGAGGSLTFADPAAGVAFAYVMNHLRFSAGDARSETLVDALYGALEG